MRIIVILILLGICFKARTQTMPVTPSIEELMRLSTLSPEEQERWRQQWEAQAAAAMQQLADSAGIGLNEDFLPGSKIDPPVKDSRRLAALPVVVPDRNAALGQISRDLHLLRSKVPASTLTEVNQILSNRSSAEIHAAALLHWYSQRPQSALLLALESVSRAPEEGICWNTLGALYNMGGMAQKAVPVLLYARSKHPSSSMLLNNLGQAYLGLGDLIRAEQVLKECLSQDPMNPEANHSMAMLAIFRDDRRSAEQYLKRELQVAQRRGTLALLQKLGYQLDIADLRKRKLQLDGGVSHDYYSEIELEKFEIPDYPASTRQSVELGIRHRLLNRSAVEEYTFWFSAGLLNPEGLVQDGKKGFGLYKDLVEVLLEDIYKEFTPEYLAIYSEDDLSQIDRWREQLDHDLANLNCPEAPAGATLEVIKAYDRICCEKRDKLYDAYIVNHNSLAADRVRRAKNRWKDYINLLIYTVTLCPDAGNRILVYQTVANYFGFLASTYAAGCFIEPDITCWDNMGVEEAEELIKANHNLDLECPDWLKLEASYSIAKLSLDCEAFNIELTEGLTVLMSKNFKTGYSTLAFGAGLEGSYKGFGAGATEQVFISFDRNGEFGDAGLRGSGSLEVKLMGKLDFGYSFGVSSGFVSTMEAGGVFSGLGLE